MKINTKYDLFDVVIVPFPFSDIPTSKKRPAVVISDYSGLHTVLTMITSVSHTNFPLDCSISNPEAAGLPKDCIIRMKIFTIDTRLIHKKIGVLENEDRNDLICSLQKLMPFSKE